MNNLPTTTAPRLPVPANIDPEQWRVLTEAIFPNARSSESIMLALAYCKTRGLDIMKRPVNIVPVWNSQLGRNVETIWPAITEIEITASRSKDWAGMDPEVLGPMITEKFTGRKEDRKKGWVDVEMEVTYPEFVRVTVYRWVHGTRCAFTETMYWKENYGRYRGGNLPNDMWAKRPRNQAIKVAKAFSLRAAFPEEAGEISGDEMEGQTIDVASAPTPPADNWQPPMTEKYGGGTAAPIGDTLDRAGAGEDAPKDNPEDKIETTTLRERVNTHTGEILAEPHAVERKDNEPWRDWCSRLLVHIRAEGELAGIEQWVERNKKTIEALVKDAPKIHAQLAAAIGRHRVSIIERDKVNSSDEDMFKDDGNGGNERQDRAE